MYDRDFRSGNPDMGNQLWEIDNILGVLINIWYTYIAVL